MNIPEAATFADALDGLGAGFFLVEETGRIVYANASGRALLHERTVLRGMVGRLVAHEACAATALKGIFAMAGCGEAADRAMPIAIPLNTRDGTHYVAHVLLLASHAPWRVRASSARVAAVFVHKAAVEAPSQSHVIARLYRLTPSELRVLLAIVDVGGVPGTAEALGIAKATVKTHLHRVFDKTGARRQADLVKLVAAFSNPFLCRAHETRQKFQ